jgi:hypothetical protein
MITNPVSEDETEKKGNVKLLLFKFKKSIQFYLLFLSIIILVILLGIFLGYVK